MDIRINYIELCNFKGIRSRRFNFGGKNATVKGDNGTGKSTIFDAFTWLLFGKDHRDNDQSHFDIKTIDPETNQPIHHLDHWVEAELVIDGTTTTLKRTWEENWVKPRGEAEQVLKGHTSTFFVDDLALPTKKEYDATISQWIGESVFRLITNPHYFIDNAYTNWQDRRKFLLSMVEEAPERKAVREKFADLIAQLNKEPLETFRKRIAQERKAAKKQLEMAQNNIDAYRRILPEEVGNEKEVRAAITLVEMAFNAKIGDIQAEIDKVDAAILDINSANSDKLTRASEVDREITRTRLDMGKMLRAAVEAADKDDEAIYELKREHDRLTREIAHATDTITMNDATIGTLRHKDAVLGKTFEDLRAEYQRIRSEVYDESRNVCPTCGQELPSAHILEARSRWAKVQKEAAQKVIAEANKVKAEREVIAQQIQDYATVNAAMQSTQIADLQKALTEVKKQIAEASYKKPADRTAIEAEARKTPEFIALAKKEMDLMAELQRINCETISPNDLLQKKSAMHNDILDLQKECSKASAEFVAKLQVIEEYKRMTDLIAREECLEELCAEEVARLERIEFEIQAYAKADVDSVRDILASMFRIARWKMTDETLEGGIIECCEVVDVKGIPYRSMNDALKIQVGMDVIRMMSEKFNSFAPIFIDNAESITQESFDTTAQVIRLQVVKGADLEIINN